MGNPVDDEIRTFHPSYGLVQFCRMTGNPGRLFGSPLTCHEHFVSLKIGRGERVHRLGEDTYFGSMRGDYIEVWLSAAQFADLVTTMNIGTGVPCTVHRLMGHSVDGPPDEPTESEHVQTKFEDDAKKLADKIRDQRDQVRQMFESKRSIGQKDKEEILRIFDRMIMEVSDNMPFMLERFRESTEKVVQHAKTEIDAFVSTCAMAEGIKSLTDKARLTGPVLEVEPARLPEKKP